MSARSIRRAAERKERKLERKQLRLATENPATAAPHHLTPLEDEFSSELIAEGRALRERVRARAEINRANAAHSTGPVTPPGKLASSRNSLKHGLASGQLLIPSEDPAAFESLLAGLTHDFQPANSTEELLVRQMAQSHWLEQRAIRLQNDCFTPEGISEKQLSLFLRYQTTHQRAFYKALHELTRLQKERRRLANTPTVSSAPSFVSEDSQNAVPGCGFVSQTAPHPPLASPPQFAEAS